MGNLTRYSVGGAVFSLSYDQQKNLAEATDGLGCTVQYSYEPDHNRLTRFSDPNGNVTTMQYDDRGNLSAVQRADGTSETFGYDARGWPIEHTVAVRAKWR